MAVASSLKILEEAETVHRLHRYENLAELYLSQPSGGDPEIDVKQILRRKRPFSRLFSTIITDEELLEGVQFLPDEMIEKAGLSKEVFPEDDG